MNHSGNTTAKRFFSVLREDSLVFSLKQKQLLTETDDSDKDVCPLGSEIERSAG